LYPADEFKSCPLCRGYFKGTQYRTVPYPSKIDVNLKNRPKAIVFCGHCGIGVAHPAWSDNELEQFYAAGDYWRHHKIERLSPKNYPVPHALAVSRWKLLEPFLGIDRKISILDIGAGHGFLGMVAAESKSVNLSKYTCVEKDKVLTESLSKTWSVSCYGKELEIKESIGDVRDNFECIVLSHILEHVIDPRTFLCQVLEKLTPDGILFVDVPNQDHLFKKDVFPHFLFFNTFSLRFLFEECGLKVKLIDCYGNDMERSPLNYRNNSVAKRILVKIIMGGRNIIPIKMMLTFFTRYFEMDKQNANGIWIRAVGQYYREASF
jgi:SAM-dependent methyltransferase